MTHLIRFGDTNAPTVSAWCGKTFPISNRDATTILSKVDCPECLKEMAARGDSPA